MLKNLSPLDEIILVFWLSCLAIFVIPLGVSLIIDTLDFVAMEIIKLL